MTQNSKRSQGEVTCCHAFAVRVHDQACRMGKAMKRERGGGGGGGVGFCRGLGLCTPRKRQQPARQAESVTPI